VGMAAGPGGGFARSIRVFDVSNGDKSGRSDGGGSKRRWPAGPGYRESRLQFVNDSSERWDGWIHRAAPLSLGAMAPQSVLAADLNGDHKIDLVVISTTAFPSSQGSGFAGPVVLLGNGDGTFQPPLPVSGCAQVTDAQLADLNGDGIPDR
jgi:FG-GAP-like repeat